MKKQKFGFTLAEVLVTLGILGVIGALLIPQVVLNTQKNEAGVLLGNATEQISLGLKNIIQHANDQSDGLSMFDTYDSITRADLYGQGVARANTLIREPNLFTNCESFFGTTPLNESELANYSVKAFNSNNDAFSTAISSNRTSKFKNKNGMYYMTRSSIGLHLLPNRTPDTIINIVIVDVNGADAPNRTGKDIFLFGITGRGDMIPAGTPKYKTEAGGFLGAATVPVMEEGCADNNITNGLSCTARVVKDGFKIKYY